MNKHYELAVEAALKAGKLLKNKFGQPKNIKYKSEIDIVTDSDLEAEKIIIDSIKKVFPDHDILAEETENICSDCTAEYRWIIDPLDGTTNFAHGYPLFAVSIALEHKGEIVLGVAYNPLSNELFTAQIGKGASLNGNKIQVSETSFLSQSLLSTGFPYDIRNDSQRLFTYNNAFQLMGQSIRRDGSAVLNLCYTACGRFDGFWELRLKPWDTAAASLIVQEAGGGVTDFKGNKFSIYDKEILATNSHIHSQMLEVFKSV